ncbi:hypothetical protein [Thermocatellispora tengchongensis]
MATSRSGQWHAGADRNASIHRAWTRHGVWEAGGVPPNLPVVSSARPRSVPTAMPWRNMAAPAIEEMLRANPLLGGCGKTTRTGPAACTPC